MRGQLVFEVLTVGAFAVGCGMALLSPSWGLALVMVMYTLEQALQASSPIFLNILPLANVLTALAVGIGALRAIGAQDRPALGYFSFVWLGTAALFVWSVVTMLWSPSVGTGMPLITNGFPYLVLFVWVSPLLVDDIESLAKFLRIFLFYALVVVVLVITNPSFTFWSGRLGLNLSAIVRTNPLAMGELGGNLLLVAALFRVGAGSVFTNILRVSGFFLGAILALQSGSRGQIVFAVLVAIAFYPVSVRLKNIMGFVWTVAGAVVLVPTVLYVASLILGASELRRWDSDTLAGGSEIRLQNVLDLLGEFLRSPAAWVVGLGFNAFTAITKAGSEPYSHVMFIDVLAELGIPMFVLFTIMMIVTFKNAIWLFQRFADDPVARTTLSVIYALFVYQLLLVNKQGYLWAAMTFFFLIVALARLRRRTEETDYDSLLMREDDPELEHGGKAQPE
ncbi:MAG: hypothetical protein EXS17_03410 [Phycisphaerales bacterium]|nr:hypothetical protein [Phycisphaerales bacterium]